MSTGVRSTFLWSIITPGILAGTPKNGATPAILYPIRSNFWPSLRNNCDDDGGRDGRRDNVAVGSKIHIAILMIIIDVQTFV